MKNNQLVLLLSGLALGVPTSLLAETIEQRLDRLEAELVEQKRINEAQDATIKKQQATIAEQKAALEGAPQRVKKLAEEIDSKSTEHDTEAWYRNVEVAGLVEVEAGWTDSYEGPSEGEVTLATFELGIVAPVTDWVEVGASLLYEQDDTPLEVDIAYGTIYNPEVSPAFFTAGQIYLPFGAYETNMVSDPLTLELGETRETALQIGGIKDAFNGSFYVFNGDNEKDGENKISSWGANLGFARETGDVTWGGGIGYISDLGDSDAVQDVINDNLGSNDTRKVPAWTLNAAASLGAWTLIGEYLAATSEFEATAINWKGRGAKPSAWNLELGYDFEIFNKPATFAVGVQGTDESLAIELPKTRFITAISTEIFESTALTFEWAHDQDYDTNAGGTDKSANTITAQLGFVF